VKNKCIGEKIEWYSCLVAKVNGVLHNMNIKNAKIIVKSNGSDVICCVQ